MKERCLSVLIVVSVFGSGIVIAEGVTPWELLGRYAANLKVIERHHIRSEEISEHTDSLCPEKNALNRLEFESIRNGQLRELTKKTFVIEIDDQGSVTSSEYSRTDARVWDGQQWCEVSDLPPLAPSAFFSKENKGIVRYTAIVYGGACLDGLLWGDVEPIDAILKKSSSIEVLPDMERVNGFACYVIEAVTPHGEYKIWIDPEHGCNIAKAEAHKTNDDIYFTGVIKQSFGPTPSGRSRSFSGKRPGSREAVHFYVDNVRFSEVDGVWLPMETTTRRLTEYDDRTTTDKKHYKRTYVNLKPDFEAIDAFVPEVPEGSEVHLEWSPGIRYTWRNGKAAAGK